MRENFNLKNFVDNNILAEAAEYADAILNNKTIVTTENRRRYDFSMCSALCSIKLPMFLFHGKFLDISNEARITYSILLHKYSGNLLNNMDFVEINNATSEINLKHIEELESVGLIASEIVGDTIKIRFYEFVPKS